MYNLTARHFPYPQRLHTLRRTHLPSLLISLPQSLDNNYEVCLAQQTNLSWLVRLWQGVFQQWSLRSQWFWWCWRWNDGVVPLGGSLHVFNPQSNLQRTGLVWSSRRCGLEGSFNVSHISWEIWQMENVSWEFPKHTFPSCNSKIKTATMCLLLWGEKKGFLKDVGS